ncbi:MAG: cell division protein CrgA, partial [Mycetocola sp.]
VWFKPVMFGFMLLGLAWIIVFYVSQGALPIAALESWNIVVGFGIAFIGFLMTTRWR